MSRNHRALDRRRWARVRRLTFARDGWRCRKCGRAGRLECDHTRPLEAYPEQDPYDPDGLQLLCSRCHRAKTAGENRRQPTASESAWRALVAERTNKRIP